MYPHVHYSIIYNSQVSISGWMDKENLVCVLYVCVCIYILFNNNKKENPATCNMDGILRPYAKQNTKRKVNTI